VGDRLGDVALVAEVAAPASAGAARVFRGRDASGRLVAVKVYDAAAEARCAAEASSLACLDHPNLPRLVEHAGGPQPWLATEWFEGRRLSEAIPPSSGRGRDVAAVLAQVLGALAHAHARGVLHGDLKPQNVLVDETGRVKLIDLGLAAPLERTRPGGGPRRVSGTPAYLAPERWAGGAPSPQSDVYSAGAVAHEALDAADAGPALLDLLADMRAEDPARRPPSAARALGRLLDAMGPLPPRLEHLVADTGLVPAPARELREPPLVGRDGALDQLGRTLRALAEGRGGVAVLSGEDGVGKTRLLAELARRAASDGVRVLSGRCPAPGPSRSGPYAEALGALVPHLAERPAGEVAELCTADARALGYVCPALLHLPYVRTLPDPADLSPDLNKFRVFSAVTALLRNWSRRERVLLLLDDVQWADDATIELTYYLQRNVVLGAVTFGEPQAGGALAIVMARRSGDEPATPLLDRTLAEARRAGALLEVGLQRLGPDQVRALVAGMLSGAPSSPDLLDLVAAESGGNPQAAVELVASLSAEGLLGHSQGRWRLPTGASTSSGRLGDVLHRRVARIGPAAHRLLTVAALGGPEVDLALLADATGLAPAEMSAAVSELVEARLLARGDSGAPAFVHEQLRQLVREELEPAERTSHHRRLAEALEARARAGAASTSARPTAAEIARHWLEAGDALGALRHLPDAARERRLAGNSAEALELLRTQLALFDRLPREERHRRVREALEARRAAAEILMRSGRHAEAADAFLELLASCRGAASLEQEARALVGLGATANLAGQYADAREHLSRALQLSEREGLRRVTVEARAYLIQNAYMQGRFEEAEAHHGPVLSAVRELGDRVLTAEALRQIGLSHHFRGRSEAAIPLYREALQLLSEVGDRRNTAATLHNLGILHAARGEWPVAMDCYERSLTIFREMGLRRETASCLTNVGNVHLQQGGFGEAARRYEQAQAIYAELGDRRAAAENLMNLGDVDLKRALHREGREKYRQALAVHRDLDNPAGIASATCNLAVAGIQLGQLEEARGLLAEALEIDRRLDSPRGLSYDLAASALLLAERGDDEAALVDVQAAREQARRAGDRYQVAVLSNEAARLLLLLGRRDAAHEEARHAYGEATSLGAREEEAAALALQAEAGPQVQAVERLDRAIELAARIENPQLLWRTWAAAARCRIGAGQPVAAAAAADRAVEVVDGVARRLGDEAAGFLARRDVREALHVRLELEEAAAAPRMDVLLRDYHLLAAPEHRDRARRLLARCAPAGDGAPSAELRRLRAFHEVVTSTSLESLDGVLSAFLGRVLDLVDAERGLLYLREAGELRCRVALARGGGPLASTERDVPRQVVEWVLRERRGIFTDDAAVDPRLDYRQSLADLHVKSLMAAPLVDGETVLGVAYVDRRATGTRFSAETQADFAATCADVAALVATARRADDRERELDALRRRIVDDPTAQLLPGVVGASAALRALASTARIAASSSESVLVTGPSGTGKEVVARAIHALSPRARGPFVALDCGAIPDTLVESVLFGHVRGAFTGADRDRPGIFEEAAGGTLFLDEITNASRDVQARLLRVLQEREVRRVGGRGTAAVDVRVIAATNLDVEAEVAATRFREDLYYRLCVIHLHLPPLRERPEDIPLLAEHFLAQARARDAKDLAGFTEEALRLLQAHDWPGNVRELANCVARMAAFCDAGRVGVALVPERIRRGRALDVAAGKGDDEEAARLLRDITAGARDFWSAVRDPLRARALTREVARALVALGLDRTGGSYKATAELFGLRDEEYTRFMDFLRIYDLKLDFREFRASRRKVEREPRSERK
jgi:DNA-binding NtrC family response regulator/tetratricopeptide (TPR) repeat protein